MTISIKDKALRVVEAIVSLEGEGLVNSEYDGDVEYHKERLKNFCNQCYKFIHVGLGECENTHKEWKKELVKTYDQFKKEGIV